MDDRPHKAQPARGKGICRRSAPRTKSAQPARVPERDQRRCNPCVSGEARPCYCHSMPEEPDQLKRDRARFDELRRRWHPSCLHSTSDQRRQLWRVGLEIGVVRRRIEAAEREEEGET